MTVPTRGDPDTNQTVDAVRALRADVVRPAFADTGAIAAVAAVDRLINPQSLDHLGILAAAGAIGFIGNEIAARVRLRAGKRLGSPALIADGNHARTDGLVSLAVVASAIVVALGFDLGDPIIGLVITLVILRITWQSFHTIKADPGLPEEDADSDEFDAMATRPA